MPDNFAQRADLARELAEEIGANILSTTNN
jgi:hypothetical protein